MGTIDDIGVPGQSLNNPPLTEWQKAVRDQLKTSLRTVQVLKSADQAGIASGAAAGFTATINNLRVGQTVIGLINHVGAGTGAASEFLTAAWTGATAPPTAGPQLTVAAGSMHQNIFVGVTTAAASTITLTYSIAFSNSAYTYSVAGSRASITLIAL